MQKKASGHVTLISATIDTLSVFTGNKWIWYQYGRDNNHNGSIDSGETSPNIYLDNVMFESSGLYFASVLPSIKIYGYWYFTGTNKSVLELAKDTVNTPLEVDVCVIHSITDSSLVIINASQDSLWMFYRKG